MVDKNRIPAAHGRDFVSWSLPEVGGPLVEDDVAPESVEEPLAPEVEIPAVPMLTARQLEEITNQAQSEGRAEGHAEGYASGMEEGHAAGLERGLEEGRAQARVELQQQVEQLRGLFDQLLAPIAAQQDSIETALTGLALDIARATLDREPALAPERLLPVVRAALRELPVGERNISISLHPDQLALIREHGHWPSAWNLMPDSEVEPGACRIETEHSLVDYTLALRFRQVAARLLDEDPDALPEPGLLLDGEDPL